MTLKMYVYDAKEIGLSHFHPGELRLEGFEKTKDPNQADVFVIPEALMYMQRRERLQAFPYMNGREERHVGFDVSDHEPVYSMKCMFIRCNTRPFMIAKDPNTISWAWPVEDFGDIAEPCEFKHDVSFRGWISTETRKQTCESALATEGLSKDIYMSKEFYGYIERDDPERAKGLKKDYKDSLRYARVSICGESIPGVFPYRFFEAMSAGRVGALFGSDYVLPWKDEIPWDEVSIRFPREQASNAGPLLKQWISEHSDDQIREMGKRAREYWVKFLNSRDWPRTMGLAVMKKLKELGLVS